MCSEITVSDAGMMIIIALRLNLGSMNAGSAQKVYEFFHTPEENRQMDQRKNKAEET